MVKTIEELKDLIIFAREQKLKSLKIGEISLEISDLAHISELSTTQPEMGTGKNPLVTASIQGLMDQDQIDPEDEELLYHSSRP